MKFIVEYRVNYREVRQGVKGNKKRTAVIIVLVAALIIISVAIDLLLSNRETEKTDFAMGAVISQNIKGKDCETAAEEIISVIKERENAISWRVENSEVAQLNKNKTAEVSEKTLEILNQLLDICKNSGGAVDLTVGKLTELWNIGSENFVPPSEKEIENALKNVSWEKLEIENNLVTISENQKIDLGFAGKGIACDDAKEILDKSKISEAVINVGGSLCLYGKDEFTVGIRNPLGDVSDYMAVLSVGEGFISTSGNYERFSEFEGKKYHHILSTETGYPVKNDLLSVTVFCSSGLLSDALSTACYCLGYEKSFALLEKYNAEAVFIFDTKEVKVTDGIKDKFEIKNNEFVLWKEN